MKQRPLVRAAAAAAVLLVPIGAACAGGDDDDAVLQTQTDDGSRPTTSTTAPTDDDETTGTTDTTEATGSQTDDSGGDVPEDAALDISVRTPGGMTLNVTRLSFDGDDILVDAEFKNGQGSLEASVWQGNYYSDRLRLVDDAGNEYNLIESTDVSSPMAGESLSLQPGESVSGTFAFRGPLAGEPESLSLVTNVYTEDISSYSLDEQTESYYPAFVVPMDLTWA